MRLSLLALFLAGSAHAADGGTPDQSWAAENFPGHGWCSYPLPMSPGEPSIADSLSSRNVMEVVLANKKSIATCIADHPNQNPELGTRLLMQWTIKPDGHVADVAVATPEFKLSEVGGCLRALIETWEFPPSTRGGPVRFPFKLATASPSAGTVTRDFAHCDGGVPDGGTGLSIPLRTSIADSKSEIEELEVVLANRDTIAHCLASEKTKPRTTLLMQWFILRDGGAIQVEVVTPEFKGTTAGRCMTELIRTWKFPENKGRGRITQFAFGVGARDPARSGTGEDDFQSDCPGIIWTKPRDAGQGATVLDKS